MVMQLFLILLVGYRVIVPATPPETPGASGALADSEKVRVQTEVLDRVIEQLEGGNEGVVTKLQEERANNELLEAERRQLLLGAKSLQERSATQADKIASPRKVAHRAQGGTL